MGTLVNHYSISIYIYTRHLDICKYSAMSHFRFATLYLASFDTVLWFIARRIHGTGIFTYMDPKKESTIHVGKYTMDPMGC